MSIIYDALQKTQQNIKNNREIVTQKKPRRNFHWIDVFLLILIVSLLILVIYAYCPKFNNSTHKAPVTAHTAISKSTEKITSNSSPLDNSHPVATEYKGKLLLKGVFLSDQEKFALINNQSIHIGDTLEGKKIVAIELDKVVLQEGNQLFVLRTTS